ncbi:DUF3311 domain-containing protein [Haloferacaceae archaeon DSL9]
MTTRNTRLLWTVTFLVLIAFSVPWFLWGDARVVGGLPLWLWWHMGWMIVASVVFTVFARTGWEAFMGVTHG